MSDLNQLNYKWHRICNEHYDVAREAWRNVGNDSLESEESYMEALIFEAQSLLEDVE
jgi:hypothetical protein